MQTAEITINGKKFQARELTLENYPECMEAFTNLSSDDRHVTRDAFYVVLEKCTDATEDDQKNCTLREMLDASKVIMEINGLVSSKKVNTEAVERTDTASEA